jgi:hypothetical protein
MEMIIAELHEQSRQIFARANLVRLASLKLEGKETLPALTAEQSTALVQLNSREAILKEARAVRRDALSLKLAVHDNQHSYPTTAAMHRRLSRACQSSSLAIEAEARLLKMVEGESELYLSLGSEAQALSLEASAHMNRAHESEQKLLSRR